MFFIISLSLINLILWFVFLYKFKKLFTTEDIISSSKSELDKIISDVNRNVDRNVTVIDDAIARLRQLNAETEKKIKLLADLNAKTEALPEFKSRVSDSVRRTNPLGKSVEKAYARNRVSPHKRGVEPDTAVFITPAGETKAVQDAQQQTLFDEQGAVSQIKTTAEVMMTEGGASYAEIPVMSPKVYASETPVTVQADDLKSRILLLFDRGRSIEDIAAELSCSTTEVQFALTLENRL